MPRNTISILSSIDIKKSCNNALQESGLRCRFLKAEILLICIKMGFNESLHMVEIIDNEIFRHGKK